jgi:D-3-phosphoglycerate dehydrogenase / 2-oxoglutarate reductase
MRIVIPDDYQDAVRHLDSFRLLDGDQITIYNDSVKDTDRLAERLQDAEALVLIRERTPIHEALLARLPNLKLIVQTGRGAPHIDTAACTRHGVAVIIGNSSGTSHATSELTWGLVLAAMRHIPQEYMHLKEGRWQTTLGTGLHGRTLGIFGYGNIGHTVANYGRAFGMRVLVWGRENSLTRARANGFEAAADKATFFRETDVLSLHVKLSAETRGLITASDLAQMKPSAVLVNTSRAPLIEPGALVAALRAGRPGFAAVDVYEEEPTTDHPLLHMENAICLPHLGYVEKDSYENLFGMAFRQLHTFISGDTSEVINPQVLAPKIP